MSKRASFHNILEATTNHGWQRFVGRGTEVFHACLRCGAEFPQTDDGWKAKRQHEYEKHGQAELFDWRDLHGKRLEIAVVETDDTGHWESEPHSEFDIYGRDETGTVYHLATANRWRGSYGGWKWRNGRDLPLLNSPQNMPSGAASPSNGSSSTGGK